MAQIHKKLLIKLEPCIILKLLLNFRDSEPQYSYELYAYRKKYVSGFKLKMVAQSSPIDTLWWPRSAITNLPLFDFNLILIAYSFWFCFSLTKLNHFNYIFF